MLSSICLHYGRLVIGTLACCRQQNAQDFITNKRQVTFDISRNAKISYPQEIQYSLPE